MELGSRNRGGERVILSESQDHAYEFPRRMAYIEILSFTQEVVCDIFATIALVLANTPSRRRFGGSNIRVHIELGVWPGVSGQGGADGFERREEHARSVFTTDRVLVVMLASSQGRAVGCDSRLGKAAREISRSVAAVAH